MTCLGAPGCSHSLEILCENSQNGGCSRQSQFLFNKRGSLLFELWNTSLLFDLNCINLLMGDSLLALSKSIYYYR